MEHWSMPCCGEPTEAGSFSLGRRVIQPAFANRRIGRLVCALMPASRGLRRLVDAHATHPARRPQLRKPCLTETAESDPKPQVGGCWTCAGCATELRNACTSCS